MWHSVSHTSRTINSSKGIRLGDEEKKGDFSASVDSGREMEKKERILRHLPQIYGDPSVRIRHTKD